ncbi:MAG: hypothetical protein AAF773_28835, partial [Cyanobacteria bacterium P01_D01_bin.115]
EKDNPQDTQLRALGLTEIGIQLVSCHYSYPNSIDSVKHWRKRKWLTVKRWLVGWCDSVDYEQSQKPAVVANISEALKHAADKFALKPSTAHSVLLTQLCNTLLSIRDFDVGNLT